MWLGVSVWGRGAVARGIFLHPLSSWITKNPFYLSHIHVILIPGNIPKTNLEVPHFLRPGLARFTTKTSQKWAKTRKKRYLCGQIHNPKLVFFESIPGHEKKVSSKKIALKMWSIGA